MVEGKGIGDDAPSAHSAVGRHETRNPAKGGRVTDRPAGVRSQGPHVQAGDHRCTRAHARTARESMIGLPRLSHDRLGLIG
jgi:hypothetical protein